MRAGALSLRDTEWSSWSSLLGWHVRGIWAPNSEGTDIHTVDASRDQTMVVRFPTESPEADCGSLGWHAHTLSPTLSSMPDSAMARAGGGRRLQPGAAVCLPGLRAARAVQSLLRPRQVRTPTLLRMPRGLARWLICGCVWQSRGGGAVHGGRRVRGVDGRRRGPRGVRLARRRLRG